MIELPEAVREYFRTSTALTEARAARDQAFKRAFPPGTRVYWLHGQKLQAGEVLEHSAYGARLRARNLHTGNKRWIEAYALRFIDGATGGINGC